MPIRIQCPSCQKFAHVPDSARGKTAKCKCGTSFTIFAEAAETIASSSEDISGDTNQIDQGAQEIADPETKKIILFAVASVLLVLFLAFWMVFGYKVLIAVLILAGSTFGLCVWKARRDSSIRTHAGASVTDTTTEIRSVGSKFCTGCGQPWNLAYKFCPSCGHNPNQNTTPEPKPAYSPTYPRPRVPVYSSTPEEEKRPGGLNQQIVVVFIVLVILFIYANNSNSPSNTSVVDKVDNSGQTAFQIEKLIAIADRFRPAIENDNSTEISSVMESFPQELQKLPRNNDLANDPDVERSLREVNSRLQMGKEVILSPKEGSDFVLSPDLSTKVNDLFPGLIRADNRANQTSIAQLMIGVTYDSIESLHVVYDTHKAPALNRQKAFVALLSKRFSKVSYLHLDYTQVERLCTAIYQRHGILKAGVVQAQLLAVEKQAPGAIATMFLNQTEIKAFLASHPAIREGTTSYNTYLAIAGQVVAVESAKRQAELDVETKTAQTKAKKAEKQAGDKVFENTPNP